MCEGHFLFVLEHNAMSMARENAYTIVEYSTAYPFRFPESAIMCVYCCECYQSPEAFRRHMQADHREYKARHAFAHLGVDYLKVDITELHCRVCNDAFNSLDNIAHHLKNTHCLRIDTDYELGLLPFRMEKDKLSCPICNMKSSNMRALSRHVQSHFSQCICEHCGKAYSTNTSLIHHMRNSCTKSSDDRQRRCRKCKAVITSLEEHLKTAKLCRQHICSICGERFGYWKEKQAHMETAHGVPKRTYKCPECDMVFKSSSNLNGHFKISHTSDYLVCGYCGMKFDTKYRLDRHLLTHTGEKAFVCNVCSKRFPRKSTLNQHMWIHSEVKRHECKLCDKTFNQKVCWKSHMKMRHPELYDPMC